MIVNSVVKGYEMISLLLAHLPAPLFFFWEVVLAVISLGGMVHLVVRFFGGGD